MQFARYADIYSSIPAPQYEAHLGQFVLSEVRVEEYSNVAVGNTPSSFLRQFGPWEANRLRAKSRFVVGPNRAVFPGLWFNTIFSFQPWNGQYFHWFRNVLPHVCFLLDLGVKELNLLVSDQLERFQVDSLRALGISKSSTLRLSEGIGSRFEKILLVRGLDTADPPYPRDLLRAEAITRTASRLSNPFASNQTVSAGRVYLRRTRGSTSTGRTVINEAEVLSFLEPHGFIPVDTGEMNLEQQIKLFASAELVIAPHGSALTNLIFSKSPRVLEVTSKGHGIRPDFLQFVDSVEGQHTLCVVPSENSENDLIMPIKLLDWWLLRDRAAGHLMFTFDNFRAVGGSETYI